MIHIFKKSFIMYQKLQKNIKQSKEKFKKKKISKVLFKIKIIQVLISIAKKMKKSFTINIKLCNRLNTKELILNNDK